MWWKHTLAFVAGVAVAMMCILLIVWAWTID